jgi:hypothetical protein
MKQMRKLVGLALMSVLGVSLLTVGCERTISETKEVEVERDGDVETKEKTVKQNSDGTVTETKKETESKTPNP